MIQPKIKRPTRLKRYSSGNSEKQIKAFNLALKNPDTPMYDIMREAGYAHNSAIAPSKNLMRSKTWQELMEKYLPDEHLQRKHREFLDTPKTVTKYVRGNVVEVHEETSNQAVKALDLAYKLKGRYQDVVIDRALVVNVSGSIAQKYAPQIERYNNGSTEPKREDSSPSHNIHKAN